MRHLYLPAIEPKATLAAYVLTGNNMVSSAVIPALAIRGASDEAVHPLTTDSYVCATLAGLRPLPSPPDNNRETRSYVTNLIGHPLAGSSLRVLGFCGFI